MIDPQETEEQAAARIRRVRARKALEQAPMLAEHLRAQLTPADGRTERGELPDQRTPLLTGVTDAADELYVLLRGWADAWANDFGIPGPVGEMWRNGQTAHVSAEHKDAIPLGFRAGVTPERAHRLVTRVSAWLLWHEDDISATLDAPLYQDDVAQLVWDLRAASGLITPSTRARVVEPATARCDNPMCGADEVIVEFFGEPMAYAEVRGERIRMRDMGDDSEAAANEFAGVLGGVSVRCRVCGWQPELRPSKVARWLA